jgi:hypothetical protein
MQRRRFLKIGLASGVALAASATGIALVQPRAPLVGGVLMPSGEILFEAVARAVLDGSLPTAPASRSAVLTAHVARVADTIRGFAPHAQAELAQLLQLLDSAPGRRWFANLTTPWADATVDELQAALETLRRSTWDLRQQAYHALRDLTNAAYYAEPGTWAGLGYPGPVPV